MSSIGFDNVDQEPFQSSDESDHSRSQTPTHEKMDFSEHQPSIRKSNSGKRPDIDDSLLNGDSALVKTKKVPDIHIDVDPVNTRAEFSSEQTVEEYLEKQSKIERSEYRIKRNVKISTFKLVPKTFHKRPAKKRPRPIPKNRSIAVNPSFDLVQECHSSGNKRLPYKVTQTVQDLINAGIPRELTRPFVPMFGSGDDGLESAVKNEVFENAFDGQKQQQEDVQIKNAGCSRQEHYEDFHSIANKKRPIPVGHFSEHRYNSFSDSHSEDDDQKNTPMTLGPLSSNADMEPGLRQFNEMRGSGDGGLKSAVKNEVHDIDINDPKQQQEDAQRENADCSREEHNEDFHSSANKRRPIQVGHFPKRRYSSVSESNSNDDNQKKRRMTLKPHGSKTATEADLEQHLEMLGLGDDEPMSAETNEELLSEEVQDDVTGGLKQQPEDGKKKTPGRSRKEQYESGARRRPDRLHAKFVRQDRAFLNILENLRSPFLEKISDLRIFSNQEPEKPKRGRKRKTEVAVSQSDSEKEIDLEN